MYRVAILGCENSHANIFLDAVLKQKLVDDVEFVGVYSDNKEAALKLQKEFGVPAADSYDAFVGKVDGIIVTARHGDNHYKYAKPYIASGIPMFIDKPITCSEEDAKAFRAELEDKQIRVSGGSVCALAPLVQQLKQQVAENPSQVLGGRLRAPVDMHNIYGGFFFYAQHLVQVMTEIFGAHPISVQAFPKGKVYTCFVRYTNYDVTIVFTEDNYRYYAGVDFAGGYTGAEYGLDGLFEQEFMEYYRVLKGEPQRHSYDAFFAPVYILNALAKSLETGEEVPVNPVQ